MVTYGWVNRSKLQLLPMLNNFEICGNYFFMIVNRVKDNGGTELPRYPMLLSLVAFFRL